MLILATQEQKNFYERKLYPLQDIILNSKEINYFYLTGGTALSRFYYNHRFSDDLDFFCDGLKYTENEFAVFFQRFVYSIENEFDEINVTLNNKFFKRLFVKKNNIELKIEFIYEALKTIGSKIKINNFYLDSKENICANKITAISDRKTLKDFLDLYFLLEEFDFNEVIKWAEYKMVPLDYETAILAFKDIEKYIEGDVLLINAIDEEDFKFFRKKLIKMFLDYAKSK